MTPTQRRIFARMPADDRERLARVPTDWQGHLIELWESAERNQRRGARSSRSDTEQEVKQDELDELLLSRASKGEYGPAAREAVSECATQWQHGTSRRGFLRAVRVAVEATRGHAREAATHGAHAADVGSNGVG